MTAAAAVARAHRVGDHALLPAYAEHCDALGLSQRARRDRSRIAQDFLTLHPDLSAWMREPTADRVLQLRRTGAWPLLVFAIGTGRVRLDLELATAKHLQGLGSIVEQTHPDDFATARAAGLSLGWTPGWVDTVLHECLAVVLACTGDTMSGLNPAVLQQFQEQLEASPTAPASSIRAVRSRLASLRQLLFEVGVLDQPPHRRPWGRTLEQRFNDVAMAEPLRATLLRYVHTRAAVLRPKSVESLVNDLLPFAEFLTAHHREVTALRHLQRAHIEPSSPGTEPGPGAAAKPDPARSGLRSRSPPCSACATCSRTSPPGAGPTPQPSGSASPPISPSSTGPFREHWPRTLTPH